MVGLRISYIVSAFLFPEQALHWKMTEATGIIYTIFTELFHGNIELAGLLSVAFMGLPDWILLTVSTVLELC